MNMKRFFTVVVLAFISIIFGIEPGNAQITESLNLPDSGYVQIIQTNDGSTLFGRITTISDDEVEFLTQAGNLKIKIVNIKTIKDVPQTVIKNGEYWFPNPNRTRLYFAPTARMMKKGEGYFQNIWLFYGGFAYGITDNITIGGGSSLFPAVDINDQLYYFTPKVGIKTTGKFDLAAGALIVRIPGFDTDEDTPTVGILYGVGTYGGEDDHITGGIGYGFVDSDLAEDPMLMLGFEKRLSRRTAFVSENWKFPGVDGVFISYGIRFFGEKVAVDFSFINFTDNMIYPGIPYLDFVFNF